MLVVGPQTVPLQIGREEAPGCLVQIHLLIGGRALVTPTRLATTPARLSLMYAFILASIDHACFEAIRQYVYGQE